MNSYKKLSNIFIHLIQSTLWFRLFQLDVNCNLIEKNQNSYLFLKEND